MTVLAAGRRLRPAAPGPAARPRALFAALVLVTGVGPLALDTYLPALPAMQKSLHTSSALVQLTVTAFIIGLAVGQLLAGPLSDSAGRRRYLVAGTLAFTVLSLCCALAPSGPVLVGLRLLHGIVGGVGVSCGRAVVSDTWSGEQAATKYGTLSSINLIGPVVAPVLGGAILTLGDWRTVFWFLVALGVLMSSAVWFGVPETLPEADRHPGGLPATWSRMRALLVDRAFMRHVVIACLATASFFTYIGGSSIVLQSVYGISEARYATLFAVDALAMVLGSIGYRVLVRRVGSRRLRAVGLTVSLLGTVGVLGVALLGTRTLPGLSAPWVCFALVTAGMGLVIPSSTTLSQEAGRRYRGTAAALQGGGAFLVGALTTPLTGLFSSHTLLPMGLIMVVLMSCAAGLLVRPEPVPAPS